MRISTEKREARREFLEQREVLEWMRGMYARIADVNSPARHDWGAKIRKQEKATLAKARIHADARKFRPVIVR